MDAPPLRNLELEAQAFAPGDHLDNQDALRVYADWLQSVGDPRGELVSLELVRRDAFASERKRIAEEVAAARAPYLERFHVWAQDHDLLDVEVKLERGFVHTLKAPLAQLRPHLDALFEREPIQRLTLTEVDDDLLMSVAEAGPAWAPRLRYLKIVGDIGALGAAALAALELPGLTGLNLLGNQLDAEACTHLASLATTQLGALTLTANQIDDDGLGHLLEAPTRGQWRRLYLADNPIAAAGLTKLAASSGLALTHLFVRGIDAAFSDAEVLLDGPGLASLQTLEMSAYGSYRARELLERMRARFGPGLRLL